MLSDENKLRIFSGNANPDLAREIAAYLGTTVGDAVINRFNNGEVQVMINESVRGKDIFIVQPTCGPSVNDNVMELLIMADAFKRASASHITAIIPYYGYARQDRKARGREPITAKLMADLLESAGITRVVTIDLHAAQIQGFFNIPFDHMPGGPILAEYIKEKNLDDMIVVSPDLGGVSRARNMAERLNCGLAIIDKRRPEPGVAEVMNLIGSVEGKTAILVDDMVDTAGSLTEGARALKKFGAKEIYACCTHPVLTDPALSRIAQSDITELVVTNTMVKEGAQVLAFGAGCGGSLGNYAYMQPFDLEKYGSLVDKGIKPFVMLFERDGFAPVFAAIKGQFDSGVFEPQKLRSLSEIPFSELLFPLLERWRNNGLMEAADGVYKLTPMGLFWQNQLNRAVMIAVQYLVYGPRVAGRKSALTMMSAMENRT